MLDLTGVRNQANIDLRPLLRELGGRVRDDDMRVPGDNEREALQDRAREIEQGGAKPIGGPALHPHGYVDGIQAARTIGHINGRPVTLVFVAAGAVGDDSKPKLVLSDLYCLAAAADASQLNEWAGGLAVRTVEETEPPAVVRAQRTEVRARRDRLEYQLVEQQNDNPGVWVLDGDLTRRTGLSHGRGSVVGVIKTFRSRWLADETILWTLPAGHRSNIFVIDEHSESQRYSCYIRLHDASEEAWSFGLVRLEAFRAEHLEPLAVTCMQQRQGPTPSDSRWHCHLSPVRRCEEFLRALRPPVLVS